ADAAQFGEYQKLLAMVKEYEDRLAKNQLDRDVLRVRLEGGIDPITGNPVIGERPAYDAMVAAPAGTYSSQAILAQLNRTLSAQERYEAAEMVCGTTQLLLAAKRQDFDNAKRNLLALVDEIDSLRTIISTDEVRLASARTEAATAETVNVLEQQEIAAAKAKYEDALKKCQLTEDDRITALGSLSIEISQLALGTEYTTGSASSVPVVLKVMNEFGKEVQEYLVNSARQRLIALQDEAIDIVDTITPTKAERDLLKNRAITGSIYSTAPHRVQVDRTSYDKMMDRLAAIKYETDLLRRVSERVLPLPRIQPYVENVKELCDSIDHNWNLYYDPRPAVVTAATTTPTPLPRTQYDCVVEPIATFTFTTSAGELPYQEAEDILGKIVNGLLQSKVTVPDQIAGSADISSVSLPTPRENIFTRDEDSSKALLNILGCLTDINAAPSGTETANEYQKALALVTARHDLDTIAETADAMGLISSRYMQEAQEAIRDQLIGMHDDITGTSGVAGVLGQYSTAVLSLNNYMTAANQASTDIVPALLSASIESEKKKAQGTWDVWQSTIEKPLKPGALQSTVTYRHGNMMTEQSTYATVNFQPKIVQRIQYYPDTKKVQAITNFTYDEKGILRKDETFDAAYNLKSRRLYRDDPAAGFKQYEGREIPTYSAEYGIGGETDVLSETTMIYDPDTRGIIESWALEYTELKGKVLTNNLYQTDWTLTGFSRQTKSITYDNIPTTLTFASLTGAFVLPTGVGIRKKSESAYVYDGVDPISGVYTTDLDIDLDDFDPATGAFSTGDPHYADHNDLDAVMDTYYTYKDTNNDGAIDPADPNETIKQISYRIYSGSEINPKHVRTRTYRTGNASPVIGVTDVTSQTNRYYSAILDSLRYVYGEDSSGITVESHVGYDQEAESEVFEITGYRYVNQHQDENGEWVAEKERDYVARYYYSSDGRLMTRIVDKYQPADSKLFLTNPVTRTRYDYEGEGRDNRVVREIDENNVIHYYS
ncbi:MAG: hypothetical protein PHT31_07570, partial [Candidatus Omnitrophica bacterium]|nr:hypothetical protein [Candidatus Omnitrophota bacterium]